VLASAVRTWQRSLRFYLNRGFWVRSRKHDIQLVLGPALPERRFAIEDDAASLRLLEGSDSRCVLSARRRLWRSQRSV